MGISYGAVSAVKDGLVPPAGWEQESVLEEYERDRAFSLTAERDAETNAQLAQQRTNPDQREQILALYDEFRPRLFRYVCSMKLDRDQAEEVIQETFIRLTAQLLKEDNIENVQGWIVRVAHNLAVDVIKRNGRDAANAEELSLAFENWVDPAPTPEETYLQKEQRRRMDLALETFHPQHSQCFRMRVLGFRYKDIGLAFGISEQRAALIVKQVAVRLAAICG